MALAMVGCDLANAYTWHGLVALAFRGPRNSKQRLKPVAVDETGLMFGGATGTKSAFVPWDQIESVETISHPDRDASYVNKSGLRLRVRDRQFFIYEHIVGNARLLQQVRSKTAVR